MSGELTKSGDPKIIPNAVDMEQAVIGAVLLQKGAILEVGSLKAEMFFFPFHQTIWKAIRDLFNEDTPIDLLTVLERLTKQGFSKFADFSGEQKITMWYLTELTSRVASSANIVYHSRIIVQKWMLRQMIIRGQQNISAPFNVNADAFELAENNIKFYTELLTPIAGESMDSVGDIAAFVLDNSQKAQEARSRGEVTGLPTGFNRFDLLTGGLQRGELTTVAGRPGMGKTSFVTQIALNAAKQGFPVAFCSLEMVNLSIGQRIISMESGIETNKMRSGTVETHEWPALEMAVSDLRKLPLWIDDTPALTILNLRTRAMKARAEKKIDLLVVDYLQLMDGDGEGDNRDQAIGLMTRGLKQLAKDLNIPILLLSQLSRAVETRGGDKKPILSDLRESGNIEQDSDNVIFLYRPDYYGFPHYDDGSSTAGMCDVIISKQRMGRTGEIRLEFIGRTTSFKNLEYTPATSPSAQYRNPSESNSQLFESNNL